MAGMNVDCAQCDNRLTYIGSKDYRGVLNASRPVFENLGSYPRMISKGSPLLYSPENNEGYSEFEPLGRISQPQIKTFGYWESTMPLMNEAGLSLGESSCGTKLVGTSDSMLDITELMRLALERCSTARCAVDTVGSLSEEYGFMAMKSDISPGIEGDGTRAYDDAGEALVIADESGEAWVMHITGGFEGVSKSTWVAQKVPKGHVSVLANAFTIGELPPSPTEDFRFNLNIRDTALAANLWSESEKIFHFTKIFGIDTVTFQRDPSELPIPLYTSLRTWRVYDLLAPSLNLQVNVDNGVFPFSVKPDAKISRRQIFKIFGDYYANSEFDLTEGMLAGPFGTPYRHEGGISKGFAQTPRAISIPRTSYSILGQSKKGGSVAWFATDQPMTSVYVPLLASVKSEAGIDESYRRGNLLEFDRKSAFWAFDFVSNWMTMNWRDMASEDVFPLQKEIQDRIEFELASLPESIEEQTTWQRHTQKNVVKKWWKLADKLVVKYNDGYLTRVDKNANLSNVGKSYGLPDWYNRMLGLTADVHPVWVQPWTGQSSSDVNRAKSGKLNAPKDFYRTDYQYPVAKYFDFINKVWVSTDVSSAGLPAPQASPVIFVTTSFLLGVAVGFFLRRKHHVKAEPLLG